MPRPITRLACVFALVTALAALQATTAQARSVPRIAPHCHAGNVGCSTRWHHHRINVLRGLMGQRPIPYGWTVERASTSDARKQRILTYWTRLHRATRHRYRSWIGSAWGWFYSSNADCVHGKEAVDWHSNTGNGYYGGFQYDIPTWLAAGGGRYAPRADLATPLQQVIITEAKVKAHGWGAWPNTARACGLL